MYFISSYRMIYAKVVACAIDDPSLWIFIGSLEIGHPIL